MNRPTPLDEEYLFDQGVIISSTDLKGNITYSNNKFSEISGYTKEELLNQNHNLLRHPDMPKKTFQELWQTIESNKLWTGVIKNLRSDGRYYWVYSSITPTIVDGETIGYTAARRPATNSELEESIQIYADLLAQENGTRE